MRREMFQPVPVFVGLRYSLAREHSFFVSFITWVSLLGVALGVLALITVISVMNGFESELRGRLLSLSAHATVTADSGDRPEGLAAAYPRARRRAGAHRRRALSRYRRHAEPSSGHGRGHRARHRSGAREPGLDHRRCHARGQVDRSSARNEPHRARADARLPARSGTGRHRHRHDSRQRICRRCHRAAIAEFRGGRDFRGGIAGARQRARARQSRRRRGAARARRSDGNPAQVSGRAQGARARARGARTPPRGLPGARLDAGERGVLSRDPHRENHDGPDPDADRGRGGVQHRRDAGDGGERQAHRHRHSAHPRHDPARHHRACS